jgi:hypothetical protein
MALTIVITGPLGATRTLSTPNNKIEKHANTLGYERDDYDSDLEFEQALVNLIALNIKRPHLQRQRRLDAQTTDISDVIQES